MPTWKSPGSGEASDNFGPGVEYTARATPVFADGVLYTVAGQRRQVVAIDAASGETLWTFREPETMRYLRSPRTSARESPLLTSTAGASAMRCGTWRNGFSEASYYLLWRTRG